MKAVLLALIFFFSFGLHAREDCSFGLISTELSNYRYVIVPGILNEIITHYMTEQRRFLMKNGVPFDQIHRINLSSFAMPDDAVEVIEKKIKSLPNDKEFIFIAHSKGALETLYYLKQSQGLKIKSVLLIQGPLDGASVTKLPDEKGFLGFLNFIVKKLVSTSFVKSYDKSYSSSHVRSKLGDLSDYPQLLKKIIFVESKTDYPNLKWKFKALGRQYQEYFGSVGDGVLMESDHVPSVLQANPSICRLKYKADHSDLVKAAPWSSLRVDKINRFMEKVFY